MKKDSTPVALGLEVAWENVAESFERFCLTAGIATLSEMMEQDAIELCGVRHGRSVDRRGYRWGGTRGKLGFHGGKVAIERPRVRARSGAPQAQDLTVIRVAKAQLAVPSGEPLPTDTL